REGRLGSPYRGWHALHHVIGLIAMVFVLTWIISGWLSMDHGRLFSRGQLTPAELDVAAPPLDAVALSSSSWPPLSPAAREVEWLSFAGRTYRRDRVALGRQVFFRGGDTEPADPSGFLSAQQVAGMTTQLATECAAPSVLPIDDAYGSSAALPGAPV